ncbi:MAG TPA: plastocyanin/azurin family copper-binding protein [Solirubrobacteraceae bacterium]
MARVLPTMIACVALLCTGGCGSSGKSSGAASTTAAPGTKTAVKEGIVPDSQIKIHYASPPANAPVRHGLVQISYREFTIEPDTVRAKVGSTIRWTNYDTEKCNVTSEAGPYKFASKDFGEGAAFELKLDRPGKIDYECTAYPTTMNGAIEVVK